MANSTSLNSPFRIDTFGADVTVSSKPISVWSMYLTALTSAKTATFIDASGATCFQVEVPSGTTLRIEPARPLRFSNGLIFDESASDFAANDTIWIFI